MKHTTMFFLLLMGGCLMAQANSDRSPNDKKGQVTVQGCVSRSSGDYILMQFDPGDSYVLQSVSGIKLDNYLGEEVRVIGNESPTLSDTSDAGRSAPSTTIMVNSISIASRECRS